MTDSVRHLTITLDEDYRNDDVEAIVKTIQMIRGVANVETVIVAAQDYLARSAVRAEIERELHEAVDGVFRRERLQAMAAGRTDHP